MRPVDLAPQAAGRLLLGAMPGRREPLEDTFAAFRAAGVTRVVVLVSRAEIEGKSPDYARALRHGLPWRVDELPIPDFGVPRDEAAFEALVHAVAIDLVNGSTVFVHCRAGIGRTGTFAACVLRALGFDPREAMTRVDAAGSRPESPAQEALVARRWRRAHVAAGDVANR